MSADNGIYILKTKDQYRVAHLQNSEYMYYSALTQDYNDEIISTRAVELWGDCKFTRDEGKALRLAHKWASSLPICEYGVNIVTYKKTWKHILEDAQNYAKEEIRFIKENGKENWWNLEKLQKIANGFYLSEWLHRNKNVTELSKQHEYIEEYDECKKMKEIIESMAYEIARLRFPKLYEFTDKQIKSIISEFGYKE